MDCRNIQQQVLDGTQSRDKFSMYNVEICD